MKKFFLVIVASILLMAALIGCGKKSGLEGKGVDGKGQPMAGVKVVASQVQPIKGFEQFDTTTGTDGGFKFGKLFPNSAYQLTTFQVGSANINHVTMTESGPEGQTKILQKPMSIRFQILKDENIAVDKNNPGLMWARDAGKKMPWNEAKGYVRGLDLGGYRDWRLPKKEELKQLAESVGIEYLSATVFNNVQDTYWASTGNGYGMCGDYVTMNDGRTSCLGAAATIGVWPVRSGQ